MEHHFAFPKVTEIVCRPGTKAQLPQHATARPGQRALVEASVLRLPGSPGKAGSR
jgi:hypothetical protein